MNKILNILNTIQLFQGILLAVSAKQLFKSKKKSLKENEDNEALSSQRSAGNWPFANLEGVCKTKTLDGQLTNLDGSTESPNDENVCIFDNNNFNDYYETSGCPGTTFCEKRNFISQLTIRV